MGDRYLSDLADVLRAAGVVVVELDGWQTRARSSGGYDGAPWAVFWHHTASGGDGAADAYYCTYGSDDAPVCNLVVGRDGVVHVCAAGATNTNGKGGPYMLPDLRLIPVDSANSRVIGMEISNDGVGMDYPAAQIDAAFAASLAMCAAYGIPADNVVEHVGWAPSRKIDPATADAVAGAWQPRPLNGSGSWDWTDLQAECLRRAGSTPAPPMGDDMVTVIKGDGSDTYWAWNGVSIAGIPGLEWVQWGFEAGLYRNTDPVLYPQGFVDQLVAAQGER